jgi:Escherichia/Staphylococcus phage prohead protease
MPYELHGYASLFNIVDEGGDVILPGAFAASLRASGAEGVRMLFQHDPREPVGVWLSLIEDGRGLKVHGRLTRGASRADDLARLVTDGAIDGLSIGFRARTAARDRHSGLRRLASIELIEISLVTFPMLKSARINTLRPRIISTQTMKGSHDGQFRNQGRRPQANQPRNGSRPWRAPADGRRPSRGQ